MRVRRSFPDPGSTLPALAAVLALSACGTDAPPAEEFAATPDTATPMEVEALDFAALDADGDSLLAPEELARWTEAEGIFAAWDVDGDAEIDGPEVSEAVFLHWDADEDAQVTRDEWQAGAEYLYLLDEAVVAGAFENWDASGDSVLDLVEVAEGLDTTDWTETWLAEEEVLLTRDAFHREWYALWDLDEDGRISMAEFEEGVDYWT